MTTVLQLTRKLRQRPESAPIPGVHLRPFRGAADIDAWLDLRRRAFARQKLGVRDWGQVDFRREFLEKAWWHNERMWLAEASNLLLLPAQPVGSITLAQRGDGADAKPVVHWLMVLPGFRRRGLARLLMATLERAVWDSGGRQVWLETHSQWTEAAALYEALGYGRVTET